MRSTVKLLPGRLLFTRLTFTVHWRPVSSSRIAVKRDEPKQDGAQRPDAHR